MNRWDEIQGTARDVADWVCADPADRDRMADDLIKLVGLMIQATGKGVAISGESDLNDAHQYGEEQSGDKVSAHARYLAGERMQDAAREAVSESVNAECDLERYERDGLAPAWVSRRVKQREGEPPFPADKPDPVKLRTWGGKAFELPQAPASCGAVDAADLDACGVCPQCRRSQMKVVPEQPTPLRDARLAEQAEVDRMNADVAAARTSVFGPVAAGLVQQAPSQSCSFLPGEATPACDFDPSCPTHGILGQPPQGS